MTQPSAGMQPAGNKSGSSRVVVKALQRMLGPASAAMTLDVYADLFDDDLDGVATAMETVRLAAVS